MPAPEIAGEDVDGKPLRLSDHRGKVVVLVFSGEWCGPCRANAPFFRALLTPEAQAKAPCVVLEVNTDATREPLRKAIAAGEIAWPCWFDGGVTGPITHGLGGRVVPDDLRPRRRTGSSAPGMSTARTSPPSWPGSWPSIPAEAGTLTGSIRVTPRDGWGAPNRAV